MRYGFLILAAASIALAACGGNSRTAGSFFDPVCAPDGSIVYVQYANAQGSFDGVMASRENCTWNK